MDRELLLLCLASLAVQPGPSGGGDDPLGLVGGVDDPDEEGSEEEDTTPDVEKFEPFPGPMGRVSERLENDGQREEAGGVAGAVSGLFRYRQATQLGQGGEATPCASYLSSST